MDRKITLLLLLLPFTLFAQTHHNKSTGKPVADLPQIYFFHLLTADNFINTVPDNGGTANYKPDKIVTHINGEIEINTKKKFFTVKYAADKNGSMKARIDGDAKYDKLADTYTYPAHWMDTNEKTEISIAYNSSIRMIKVLFGPHTGQYAKYWDKIIKYSVVKKE